MESLGATRRVAQTGGMKLTPLIRHPGAESAITRVEVEARRADPGVLTLRYVVTDPGAALVVPPPASGRQDNLWKRTCFEAFILIPGSQAYYELNLSPSTRWAVYRFDSFRAGMDNAAIPIAPQIAWLRTDSGYELTATADLSALAGLRADVPWRLGLTAVIEDGPDQLSYWALTHPPGVQDFHNADGWTAEV